MQKFLRVVIFFYLKFKLCQINIIIIRFIYVAKQYTATITAVKAKINTKTEFTTGKLRKDLAVIKLSSHPASASIFYAFDIWVGLNLCPVWVTKKFSFINSAKEGTLCNGF